MKHFFPSLLVCASLLASSGSAWGADAAPSGDRVLLDGGEALYGRMVSFSKRDGLTWRHPEALAPLVFKADHLRQIDLSPVPAKAQSQVWVYLANGDVLPGQLVSYDPKQVVVDTPYAGRLTLASDRVSRLIFNASGTMVSGFGKLGDWKLQNNSGRDGLRIADGKLELQGSSWGSREMPFGEQFRLEVAGTSNRGLLHVGFCLSQPMGQGDQPSGYYVYLQGNRLVVYAYHQGQHQNLGTFSFKNNESGKSQLVVTGDAQAQTLTFSVNGKRLGLVRNIKPFHAGKFLALGCNGGAVYSKLSLTPGASAQAVSADAATDQVRFANQDRTGSELLWIKAGKAALKTDAGTLEFPVERLAQVDFNGAKKKQARKPGDVRLYFEEGNARLTLAVEKIADGKINGSCENLGACTIDARVLRKIRFNLPVPGAAKPEEKEEGGGGEEGAQQEGHAPVQGRVLQFQGGGVIIQGGAVIQGGGVLQLNGAQVVVPEVLFEE